MDGPLFDGGQELAQKIKTTEKYEQGKEEKKKRKKEEKRKKNDQLMR